jgi:hypothetical protein
MYFFLDLIYQKISEISGSDQKISDTHKIEKWGKTKPLNLGGKLAHFSNLLLRPRITTKTNITMI